MGKETIEPVRFSVEELKRAKVMRGKVDLLMAVTHGEGMYTVEEANKKIEDYLKGKVN